MSTSGSDSDESSTSDHSDVDQIVDYELEVEEQDSPSDNPCREDKDGSVVLLYDDEAIADEFCVQNYKKKQEREAIRFEALQKRLDGEVPASLW